MGIGSAWCLKTHIHDMVMTIEEEEVVVVDVIELEDVFCLFGCGSFLLIVQYLRVCVYRKQ